MLLTDFPYQPLSTPEEIETAKAFLQKDYDGAASYRVVHTDTHTDYINRPCHVAAGSRPNTPRSCIALYTGESPKTKKYRDWLWKESFVAPYVLALEPKGAVVSGDIPAMLMQNICIMSRHCTEFITATHHCFAAFDDLYNKVGGDLAYVLAFTTTYNAPNYDDWKKAPLRCGMAAHKAWPLFSLSSLQKFLKKDFGRALDNASTELWRTHAGLYGGSKYCDAVVNDRTFISTMMEDKDCAAEVSAFRKGSVGEGYRPPNPFVRQSIVTVRSGEATLEEVTEVVIPLMKKKGLI